MLHLSLGHQSTIQVARELLGCGLVHRKCPAEAFDSNETNWTGGIIVETEAYLSGRDPASHSARGKTRSNQSMFAAAGHLYVYPIHAKYCLNVVTEREGAGAAVLIRALEPIWSIEVMRRRRAKAQKRLLTSGPAMICQALSVTRQHDGIELNSDPDWKLFPVVKIASKQIRRSPRIGVSRAQQQRLRFFVDGNRYVSGRASEHRLPRRNSLRETLATLNLPTLTT